MNDGENFSGGGDGGNISTKRSSRGRKSAAAQPPQGAQPTKRKNRARLNNQILEEMFNFSYNATGSVCATAAAAAAPFSVPKNKNQKKYMQILQDTSKKIVIATGPAGTGKTLLATEYAVRGFLDGQYNKIIFTRPSVTVDEDLGYLPGTLEEKMAPWMRPIYDILYQFYAVKEVAQMLENKTIEICPLGFMRGRTFKRCCIVADEMQNSTAAQMKMILTRIGENSRLIITGDLEQCDVGVGGLRSGGHSLSTNGLEDFLRRFSNKKERSGSISSVEFDNADIEREEVIREVLEIYSFVDVEEDNV